MSAFNFANGRTVTLRHVGQNLLRSTQAAALKKYKEIATGQPERPTYDVVYLGGAVKTYHHTDDSIRRADYATHADRIAYLKWSRTQRAKTIFIQRATFEALLNAGIAEDPGDDWLEYAKDFGIRAGETAREQKVIWVESWLVSNQKEMQDLLRAIMAVPSALEAQAAKAAERF